jgi:hypothetical protein
MVENESRTGRAAALHIRETFQDRPSDREETFEWSWPKTLRLVGEGYSVMYSSDKWHKRGDFESYKHVCESKTPWKVYAAPGFSPKGATLVGSSHPMPESDMPSTIATLANFLGLQARLFQREGSRLVTPEGDDGIYQIQIPRAKLGAGRTKRGKLFLTVFDKQDGPQLFIFGDQLDVEKDGIVG